MTRRSPLAVLPGTSGTQRRPPGKHTWHPVLTPPSDPSQKDPDVVVRLAGSRRYSLASLPLSYCTVFFFYNP